MSYRLENMDSFEKARRRVRGVAVFQLNSMAESMVVLRKELAPKDTEWMANRTRQTETAEDENLRAVVLCDASNNPFRGGNNVAYDEAVEYGTADSDAQPSATPAYESAKKQISRLGAIF